MLWVACDGDDDTTRGRARSTPDPESAARVYEAARVLGRIEDQTLVEISGIVAARVTPRSYWVHNDSGGEPAISCVRADGRPCGTVVVPGATAVDWEDIAAGSDGSLYIGDIGDNLRQRDSLTIFRLPEPRAPGAGATGTSLSFETIELRYPRGARDAEVLLVHPDSHDIYIVTKSPADLVYRTGPDGGRMKLVGRLALPGLFSLPTGGDISPDGKHVILGTYGSAFEFTLPDGARFDRIWKQEPREITLPLAQQREAIAYRRDGRAIISTSEGRRPPLVERELTQS